MPTANVVNVSEESGVVDFATLKSQGIEAVVVRIGHGTTQDTNAANNISNATKAGLIVHVYHQLENVDGEVAWSLTNVGNLSAEKGSYYFLDVSKQLQIDNLGDIFRGFYRNWLQAGYKVGIRCTDDQLVSLSNIDFKSTGIYRWTTVQSTADLLQMDSDNQDKLGKNVDQTGLLIKAIEQGSHATDPNGSYTIKPGAFVGFDYSTTEVAGGKMLVASPDGANKIPKLGPDGSFFFSQKDAQSMLDMLKDGKPAVVTNDDLNLVKATADNAWAEATTATSTANSAQSIAQSAIAQTGSLSNSINQPVTTGQGKPMLSGLVVNTNNHHWLGAVNSDATYNRIEINDQYGVNLTWHDQTHFFVSDGTAKLFKDNDDGPVATKLEVHGWAWVNGWVEAAGHSTHSTLSSKTNIEPVDNEKMLDLVNSTDLTTFLYETDVAAGENHRHIGPIIDDVHDVAQYQMPNEFLAPNGKSRDDDNMIGALFGAVKALTNRIKTLESKVG